ncbi:MAG: hypothetical protein KJ950_08365 [Proteobacteria bacterium]|nr:hypothetical protein [Pseudomonadota bacterium]MBU1686505.1 hypothetical protein [Pseudomonadota bacterium]
MGSRNNQTDDFFPLPGLEEDLLYDQTIRRLRGEVERGKTYDQACKTVADRDLGIQMEVAEDFLKIIIAERHFGEGYGLDDLALILDVSLEKVEAIRDHMLSEIGTIFTRENRRGTGLTH